MQEPYFEKILRRFRLGRILPYINDGDILLDVGCGWEARALQFLAPKISHGFGMDRKVERPTALPPNVELITGLFTEGAWPIADASCHKVLMLAVLEHIEPELLPIVFANIERVLKKSGRLILTVPTPPSQPVLEFLAYRIGMINAAEIRDHKVYYDRDLLQKTLGENRFQIETYKTFQFGLNSLCVATPLPSSAKTTARSLEYTSGAFAAGTSVRRPSAN